MATTIFMPRQGQTVESCTISEWCKKKGDKVKKGDVLFIYETDKATFDMEAESDGIILDILHDEGEDVPVLKEVCIIGEEGESVDSNAIKKESAEDRNISEEIMEAGKNNKEKEENKTSLKYKREFKITPRARKLAKESNLDYRDAEPTGPRGRIVEADILGLKEKVAYSLTDNNESEVKELSYEEIPLSNIRKVIAQSMLDSIATTAQLTLNIEFDASDILHFRKKVKENKEKLGLEDITLNDIFLYVISRTILNHRVLNAHLVDDKILVFNNVNLGVAVDTERGLMVPTLFNANIKSLNDISKEVKTLVRDCQAGRISPDILKGGSFTVTNLGVLGIESFTPIINPPQTGILGINTIVERLRKVKGKNECYPSITLSLTFDHRALDGVPAAKFLQDLKTNMENFTVLFAK